MKKYANAATLALHFIEYDMHLQGSLEGCYECSIVGRHLSECAIGGIVREWSCARCGDTLDEQEHATNLCKSCEEAIREAEDIHLEQLEAEARAARSNFP